MMRDTVGLYLHSTGSNVRVSIEEHAQYPDQTGPYWVINIKIGHHDMHLFVREKPTFDLQLEPVIKAPDGWSAIDTSHD